MSTRQFLFEGGTDWSAATCGRNERNIAVPTRSRDKPSLMLLCGYFLCGAIALRLLIPAAHAQAPGDAAGAGRARYAPLLAAEAAQRGIPRALADAVATVESGYDPRAEGASGEVGLMQVLPSTAELLGFRGSLSQLADPATNIHFGVLYLAGAWEATGGRLCETLMKYRAGYGEATMSLRSVIYCRRARDYLASIDSPLARGPGAEVPQITPDMLAAAADANRSAYPAPPLLTRAELARLRNGHRTADDSRRFWVAEKAYIRALRRQLDLRRLAMTGARSHKVALAGIATTATGACAGALPGISSCGKDAR